MKKIIYSFVLFFLFTTLFFAQTKGETQNIFAKSYTYVNDFEKILTADQVKTLNAYLKSNDEKTANKIVVVTVSSINPYTDLTDYSLDLDKYLLSKLKTDTSILIVISKQLRQIQVQGVEKIRAKMSDQEMKNIVSTYAVPELKKGDYYKGLQECTRQFIKKME